MSFEEEGEKGLASKLRNSTYKKKIVSGLSGAAFDNSYAQFVDEDDNEYNDSLAESMNVDKMGKGFHFDNEEHTE